MAKTKKTKKKVTPSYESKRVVKAFRIAEIVTTKTGKTLRSVGRPQDASEINISNAMFRALRPKEGQYVLEAPEGGLSVVSRETFEANYSKVKKRAKTGRQDRIEAAAMQAYEIWRARYPKEKIKGKLAPAADILFNDPDYAYHAKQWLEAAEETPLS